MTTRTKQLALLLVAAVVLASGAYALGSQSGGGGALASGSSGSATSGSPARDRGFRRGGDFGLDALATRLGVSTTALRDALQAIRSSKTPEQRRQEFIEALASALGKPADQVTSAVNSVLPDRGARRDGFGAALARELGVDAAKVQAAFDKLRSDFRNRRRDRNRDRRTTLANALATELGIDAARVRAALDKLKPARGDRRDRGDDIRRRLATALGVTTDQLETALDKARTDARNAFASELAQRLNIDVQKVQDALQDLPGRGFGRRHG
jgi:hypothetical protein